MSHPLLPKHTIVNRAQTQLDANPELASAAQQPALVGQALTQATFDLFAGKLGKQSFIKIVYDREQDALHFINGHQYQFHADYIGDHLLKIGSTEVRSRIDEFNETFYFKKDRRLYLGSLALQAYQNNPILILETVEVDTMDEKMLLFFFQKVRQYMGIDLKLYLKPVNLWQEKMTEFLQISEVPFLLQKEIYQDSSYICLNPGTVIGRLRVFKDHDEYIRQYNTIKWFDILAMDRVPDDIPEVSGIINSQQTSPLSHTNVLAHNWKIPNAIQIGVITDFLKQDLNGHWVRIVVPANGTSIEFEKHAKPLDLEASIRHKAHQIKLDTPNMTTQQIVPLLYLRKKDSNTYGTKAANLGELFWVKNFLSIDLIRYYEKERPPRKNLLPSLAKLLNTSRDDIDNLRRKAWFMITDNVHIPRGVALPFAIQQDFLKTYPHIQKQIAELKACVAQNDETRLDTICNELQKSIIEAEIPPHLIKQMEVVFKEYLQGTDTLVVRSSSNAEDLPYFSAAGLYESVTNVTDVAGVFASIKVVWASLISPRSVRLRHKYGMDLTNTYMGAIIQAKIPCELGGVMVTCNPFQRDKDFRHVYLNVIHGSVEDVVSGEKIASQYLFNTVEGGGTTITSTSNVQLTDRQVELLQKLALIGRLLESHFNSGEDHETPLDIEWLINRDHIYILQVRPYEG